MCLAADSCAAATPPRGAAASPPAPAALLCSGVVTGQTRDSLHSQCLVLLWEKLSSITSCQQIAVSAVNCTDTCWVILRHCRFSAFSSVPVSHSTGQNPRVSCPSMFHSPGSQFPCTFYLTNKTCFPERLLNFFLRGFLRSNESLLSLFLPVYL